MYPVLGAVKEYFATRDIPPPGAILNILRGTGIKAGKLTKLVIYEGILIENAGSKMFVNKNASRKECIGSLKQIFSP